MREWLSYSLHDLLIFSPGAYFLLFEHANTQSLPVTLLALMLAAALLVLTWMRGQRPRLAMAVLMAVAWLLSGWWFQLQHYAQINTLAGWYAGLFFLQAFLLLLFAGFEYRQTATAGAGVSQKQAAFAQGMLMFALLIHPWLGLLWGRDWPALEIFAIAPEPTAIAGLALALLFRKRLSRLVLSVIPLFWLIVAALTYTAFGKV